MNKGKFFQFKLILMASVLLNLAFISGFAVKKVRAAQKHKETHARVHQEHAESEHAATCVRQLCKHNPQFKKIFEEHKSYCYNRCNDLVHMKTQLLNQLKNNHIEPERHQELNHQIQTMTHELHDHNHQHLMLLKKHLNQEEFANLIDHMIGELSKQQMSTGVTKQKNKKQYP